MALRRLLLLMALAGWSGIANANDGVWTVAEASGAVEVQGAPTAHDVAVGPGAVIATGRDGRATLRRGGDSITLAPNSRVSLDAGGAIVAERGNSSIRTGTPLSVATRWLSARTQRGSFGLSVTAGGASFQVREGAAEVATADGGAVRTLGAGMIGLVSAQEAYQLMIDGTARALVQSPNDPKRPAETPPALSARLDGGAVEIASLRP